MVISPVAATAAPISAATQREHDDNHDQDGFDLKVHRNPPLASARMFVALERIQRRLEVIVPGNPWTIGSGVRPIRQK
jgi:hypothetical protein